MAPTPARNIPNTIRIISIKDYNLNMEQGREIFRVKIGSHLYGLNRPDSDLDYMGVFIPRSDYLLGLKRIEEVDNSTKNSAAERRNTAEDVDDKSYTLPKYLHLALQNNPNIVEVLFATPENVLVTSPEWEELVANRSKILSRRVFSTFMGYAFSQKKKLTVKSERFHSLEEALKWIIYVFPTEQLDRNDTAITKEQGDILNGTVKYYKSKRANCESFHDGMSIKMIYEHLKEEYENYGWRVHTDTFETLGYDVKFAYHLIRILAEGIELLTTGELHYPISGESRADIVAVREGKLQLPELLAMYDKYELKCKEADAHSVLPQKANFNWADKWLIGILKKSIIEEV
jgi:uncharacterized protein